MNIKEIYAKAKQTGKGQVVKFMKDMKKAKMPVIHYQFSNWSVPGVNVTNIQDVLNNTTVLCSHDKTDEGYIVYPVEKVWGI